MAEYSIHPLDPIIYQDAHTLILGSFPSLVSVEKQFYYAHPRNQFWPLLSALYQLPAHSTYERIALLQKTKLAIWDVVHACERTNSADTNLKNITVNDIEGLLRRFPRIMRIGFTGKKAYTLFQHYFSTLDIPTFTLPSPSPAFAAMSFEEKLERWRRLLQEKSGI